MPKLHQRSLLRRGDAGTKSISMIESRSTSGRTAGRMASARRCPSWNYDLYHAYTSLLAQSGRRSSVMMTILINFVKLVFVCRRRDFFLLCRRRRLSASPSQNTAEFRKKFIAKPKQPDFCVNSR